MRDLAECSGPWSGFWLLGWTRGHMKLNLRFTGTDIVGEGTDVGGPFQVNGIFSRETNKVMFTKAYQWQNIDYCGTWDGHMIYGTWSLHDQEYSESGEFEIWPDTEEESVRAWEASWSESLTAPGG
jgi:hypothetical protein